MPGDRLFELRRRTFDSLHFRGIEFIEVEAKSVINKVPGGGLPFSYTINPYRGCTHACVACFARPTHTYLDMDAGRDFETKIVVKVNAPEVLRKELRSRRWRGESIAMGTNTDPYQRAEGRYRITRGILEALVDFRNPFSILTRAPLLLRDLDLLQEAAKVSEVSTAFSIPTLDEEAWRKTEPGAPHPRKRMEAVRRLNEAGIPCGVMVAPVIPFISDSPRMLEEVVRGAIDAGATHVSPILLHLRPGVREQFMSWLVREHPDLVGSYEGLYARSSYGPKGERNALGRRIGALIQAAGGYRLLSPPRRRRRPAEAPKPKQLQLLQD